MQPTVRTLLDRPELGLALLTPPASLPPEALDAAVVWAHSSDLVDPAPEKFADFWEERFADRRGTYIASNELFQTWFIMSMLTFGKDEYDIEAGLKAVQDANTTLNWGFGQLITIGNYTNQALAQNAAQNDTMICILEHISKNTCLLLNEAHEQTGLQRGIQESTKLVADLYAATHAEAALTRPRTGARCV